MDLATLGIRVVNTGVAESTAGLNNLAASGARAEASAQRTTVAYNTMTAAQRQIASMSAETRAALEKQLGVTFNLGAAVEKTTSAYESNRRIVLQHAQALAMDANQYENNRAMVLAHAQALEMDAAMQNASAKGAGVHGLQLGRLNQEIGTAIGRMTGMNTAATRLGSQIGGAVTGYGQMILITAAIAAAAYAYDKLTESVRKAEKEQKRLNKVTEDYLKTQGRPAGDLGAAQVAQQTQADEAAKKLAKAQADAANTVYNAKTGLVDDAAMAVKAKRVADLTKEYNTHAAAAGALRGEVERLTAASAVGVTVAQLGVEQQRALNAAFGQSALRLREINIHYDTLAQLKQNAAHYSGVELLEMNRLTVAMAAQQTTAARLVAARASLIGNADVATVRASNDANVQAARDALTLAAATETLSKAKLAASAINANDIPAQLAANAAIIDATAAIERQKIVNEAHAQTLAADVVLRRAVVGATKEEISWATQKHDSTVAAIAAEEALKVALIDRTAAVEKSNESMKAQIDLIQSLAKGIQEAISKITKESLDKTLREINEAQEKYVQDMTDIWRGGFGKIVTDGTKSFHDFFEDVLQMFSKMMKKMEEAGKAGGMGYKLLGIGSAAITGGFAGYQAGQANGAAAGVGAGAFAGATMGAQFGPYGAAAGALAGAAGGLLGAANAQSEAAAKLREAALALMDNVASYAASAAGDSLQAKLLADNQRYLSLYYALDTALNNGSISMEEFKQQTDAVNKAHQEMIDTFYREAEAEKVAKTNADLRVQANLRLQILQLQGDDDAARALQNELEFVDALNGGASDATLQLIRLRQALEEAAIAAKKANDEFFRQADAAYASVLASRNAAYAASLGPPDITADRNGFTSALSEMTSRFTDKYNAQIKIAQDQLKVLGDTQKTAQKSHDDTAKALDSLNQFRNGLSTGQFSTLSPAAQVAAARSQLNDVFRQAQLGDKSAAGAFGQSANSYLGLLRDYGASGSTFVAGQSDVQQMVNSLITQYGVQESIDRQMLDSSTQQVDLLQQQIDLAQKNVDAVQRAAQGIKDLYDRLFGADASSADGVWQRLIGGALQDITGNNPGVNVPTVPNGQFQFGNANSAQVTVAERLMFAIMYALQNGNYGGPGGFGGFSAGGSGVGSSVVPPASHTNSAHSSVLSLAQFLDQGEFATRSEGTDAYQQYLDSLPPSAFRGYATGGDFGGGVMQVGERGPELVATGRARVMTSRDLNAPTVAELQALRDEVADLTAAIRTGFLKQIASTDSVGDKIERSTIDTSRAILKAAS